MKSFKVDKENAIIAKPEEFEDAILFTQKNKNSGIWIRYDMNKKPGAPKVDFSLLEKTPMLLKFGFSESITLKRIDNIEGIYALKKLKSLTFYEKNYALDFKNFEHLDGLAIKPSKKFKNLASLKNLSRLSLLSVDENLDTLKSLESIKSLRLTKGSITSLDTIVYFKNLETIELFYLTKLKNCDAIAKLKKLKSLYIEKCTKIENFDFLKHNQTIEELFVSDVNSISFIEQMHNLKKLKFWDLKDGDLFPIFKSKTLKDVDFAPERKHYSHSKKEVIDFLQKRI